MSTSQRWRPERGGHEVRTGGLCPERRRSGSGARARPARGRGLGGALGRPRGVLGGQRGAGPVPSRPRFCASFGKFRLPAPRSPARRSRGGSGAPPQPPPGSQPGGPGGKRRERRAPRGSGGTAGSGPAAAVPVGAPRGSGQRRGRPPPGGERGEAGAPRHPRAPLSRSAFPVGRASPSCPPSLAPSLLASIHRCLPASLRSGSGGEVAAGAPAGAAEGGGGAGERGGERPGAAGGPVRRGEAGMRGRRAGGGCGRARLKTLCLGASRLLPFLPFSSPFSRSLPRCKKLRRKPSAVPRPALRSPQPSRPRRALCGSARSALLPAEPRGSPRTHGVARFPLRGPALFPPSLFVSLKTPEERGTKSHAISGQYLYWLNI